MNRPLTLDEGTTRRVRMVVRGSAELFEAAVRRRDDVHQATRLHGRSSRAVGRGPSVEQAMEALDFEDATGTVIAPHRVAAYTVAQAMCGVVWLACGLVAPVIVAVLKDAA